MSTTTLEKVGEINLSAVAGSQILKLDPNIPYLIVLPAETSINEVETLVAFFGRNQVQVTVIVGDASKLKIFGSFPWSVQPSNNEIPHILDLPDTPAAAVLRSHFVSSSHEAAERVQNLYDLMTDESVLLPVVVDGLLGLINDRAVKQGIIPALFYGSKTEGFFDVKETHVADFFDESEGREFPDDFEETVKEEKPKPLRAKESKKPAKKSTRAVKKSAKKS